ncbi:MAG: hypothetical protein QM662_08335 [Gordonia sp. (in: high G+C Gram-positive bacteria)]
MYTRTFNVTEQDQLLDELYDAVVDSVAISYEGQWPEILRDMDPRDALWWLMAEVVKSGQRVPPELAKRVVAVLPDFAEFLEDAPGNHGSMHSSSAV